tara:strand:- start:899 stop:1066 length:168 start_codon:yes stop_codon:yes gene_type:complete
MVYEVAYETTLPPWRFCFEKIEAEDPTDLKKKFKIKHEAAHLRTYSEQKLEGSSN